MHGINKNFTSLEIALAAVINIYSAYLYTLTCTCDAAIRKGNNLRVKERVHPD